MEKKPIYPDYELHYDFYRAGLISYVRKQNSKGVWYLIPVIQHYNFGENHSNDIDVLLDFVKRFTESCYRVLMFYILPEEGLGPEPRITLYIDDYQGSEHERLYAPIWVS
jgi:hypothetical protein